MYQQAVGGDGSDTEPDSPNSPVVATWEVFPTAPADDFARLVPFNEAAKRCFQQVAHRFRTDPGFFPYAKPFVHIEIGDATSDSASLHSTPAPTDDECEDGSHQESSEIEAADASQLGLYRGFYRLNMVHPTAPPTTGWILGRGRTGVSVEFILAPHASAAPGLCGRHCRIRRLPNGALVVISDSHEVAVDSRFLKRNLRESQPPVEQYQCVAMHDAHVGIGDLVYVLRMTRLPRSTDLNQLRNAFASPELELPQVILTPTPAVASYRVRDYQLHSAVAMGVSSTVYYALHTVTGQEYAIKKMVHSGTSGRHVQNEVLMLRSLKHPRICRLENYFEERYNPDNRRNVPTETYLVLSPAAGDSLSAYITRPILDANGDGDETARSDFAREVLRQAADALAYLHDNGVMHHDIKPDNIGVTSVAPVKIVLLDFGHSQRTHESNDHMRGTIRYLAPEIMALKAGTGSAPYNHAADIWGLGITFCQIRFQVVGGRSVESLHDMSLAALQSALASGLGSVDDYECLQLAERMLSIEPSKRISARELFDTLDGQQRRSDQEKRPSKRQQGETIE